MILFWLILTPGLTIYLPTLISNNQDHLFESIAGLVIFYGMMVFMIYEHYKTDFFQLMMLSCLINIVLVVVVTWARRLGVQPQ